MYPRIETEPAIARRDFFKLLGSGAFSLALSPILSSPGQSLPTALVRIDDLPVPDPIQSILSSLVPLRVDRAGYLNLMLQVRGTTVPGRVEILPTKWNLEHDSIAYRMRTDQRMAIVLHWDGAPTGNQRSIEQLVRGLNDSVHFVTRERMSNSAHFGVGGASVAVGRSDPTSVLGIAQLQYPWHDGTPLIASHLNWRVGKPDMRHDTPAQCLAVMRSLGLDTALRSVYEGVWLDPNYRTLAIEITGRRFDENFPRGLPPTQVTANLLSLLLALSAHHSIGPWDVVGHQELQYDKPDPGKLYVGLVRYLLGILAFANPSTRLSELAFGTKSSSHDRTRLARRYFAALAEYVRRLVPPADYEAWVDYTGHVTLMEFLTEEHASYYERMLFAAGRVRR